MNNKTLEKMKVEVSKRKQMAQDKDLDKLFSCIYHQEISNYMDLVGDAEKRKTLHYINSKLVFFHPDDSSDLSNDYGKDIEFNFRSMPYRIRESDCKLELYMGICPKNPIFAIDSNEERDILCYVNDDWVDDFKMIKGILKEFNEKLKKKREDEFLASQVQNLKDNFGL